MSRKNNILKYQLFTNADMSQATLTSPVTCIQFLDNVAIQLNFTGTPTGTFQVQVSLDYARDDLGNSVSNPGTWVPITLPTSPVASGAAGAIVIDLNQLASPWIRVVYTKTSGTGTLNGFISAKQL